jgi:putative PIN family toxin of toxin-antitoxin system
VIIPRVVVDTNVVVGAFLSKSGGHNREVIRRCLKREAQPVLGVKLFSEYEDVLGRAELMKKCPLTPKDRQELLEAFLSTCEWVKVYYLWRPNLPDEGDNHLIELAVAGVADAIITNNTRDVKGGDLHFPKTQIVTPRQFNQTAFKP